MHTLSETQQSTGLTRPNAEVLSVVPCAGATLVPVDTQEASRVNATPLCLIAFAVATFMFSLINTGAVSHAIVPIVISTGLIFGGLTQLTGGLIQIATGDTLNGALFSTFASFWIVLGAYLEWFSKSVPTPQRGEAAGLLLYTFAIVGVIFVVVSLRTNVATLLALGTLVVTLALLAAGNDANQPFLVNLGGVTGIILAAQALYLATAGFCERIYGRAVIPLGQLGRK